MKVTVLGCGGSGGVPLVGPVWGECDPSNPKNRRFRPSILVEEDGRRLLVDTSPDLRQQLLASEIDSLDAVLFTHSHADHCHGIDDLRPLIYKQGSPINAYSDDETLNALRHRFAYAFESSRQSGSFYGALLCDHTISVGEPFEAAGFTCTAFTQTHGKWITLGFRIDALGYSPDAAEISEAGLETLKGVDCWIVDCLRYEPHPSHAHFRRALDWIERIAPRRAVLTHMNHTLDYADLAVRCPEGVEPGYDGLVIDVSN